MSAALRLLIVDDHLVVRRGLRALLATEPGLTIVGEAADGRAAIAATRDLAPDVVLLDLEMPTLGGLAAIGAILAERPETAILILTSFATADTALAAVRAGALGYLLKGAGPDELIAAIRQVGRGEPSLPPALARNVLRAFAGPRPEEVAPPAAALTPRETDVLRLIARGDSNDAIAATLHIGEATVRSHVSSILAKLGLASRTQAALYALRHGIATLDE